MSSRLRTLWPVLSAYFGLAALYAWQASERMTPTIFSDEIEFTQISRSIAETGRAALRGGEPAPDVSLYAYLAAPAWWLDDVGSAYGVIKLVGVLLMTAVIFPAYALARLVVSRPYALFAAIGAAAAPALAYAPFLVDEPLAYPISTLALLLIAQAGIRPSKRSVGLALAACIGAVLVRTQLAILLPVLAIVLLGRAWRGERLRRWHATWTAWDWAGAATLLVGVAVGVSAVLGHRSVSWYVATGFHKSRMLEYGLWAVGSLAIGLGLIPLIAGLAGLVGRRRERRDEPTATLATLIASALGVFGLYTAVKAAYLSTTYGIVIAERNLIYLVPLLFVGTALVLERRRPSLRATGAATAFAVYLVTATPHALDYPNYEAHGLAIVSFANRIPKWPAETIEIALVLVALGSGLALVALRLARSARLGVAAGTAIAVFALTWSLTTEIYAANGERHASDRQYGVLPLPPSWVDNLTGGDRTALVVQGISDSNPISQLEFWNRSIEYFMGLDGSAPGPGQTATPNLDKPDGTLAPHDLGAEYAVAVNGVEIAAPRVATVGGMVLYRLGGKPVRLAQAATGVSGTDGWMGTDATYTKYDVDPNVRGFVKVTFSRQAACFPQLKPVRVSVRVGPVIVDEYHQPAIGEVTGRDEGTLAACAIEPLVVRVPLVPWRVEAMVDSTFVPNALDPSQGDRRELGAQVAFEFVPLSG